MKKHIRHICVYFYILTLIAIARPTFAETTAEIETILNWAENQYPALFPNKQTTQIFDPWVFRHYPATDIYLGEKDGQMFGLGGGIWNEPTPLGSVANLFVQAQNAVTITSSSRISRILYDNDNNGANDAVSQFSYDESGRVTTVQYDYTDDGVVDIINLFDDNATQEINGFIYDSQDRVVLTTIDRNSGSSGNSERFEAIYEYNTNGMFARIDFQRFDSSNNLSIAQHWIFGYTGTQLNKVDNFITNTNALINTTAIIYGADGMPSQLVFDSPGIDVATNLQWREDGKIESIDTLDTNGSTSASVIYNIQGMEQMKSFSQDKLAIFSYAEILGENYTRTIVYDSLDRPGVIQYDINSDGSIDAVITMEWEDVACIPTFVWAPNAFPNFTMGESINVPGTGVFKFESCAPE